VVCCLGHWQLSHRKPTDVFGGEVCAGRNRRVFGMLFGYVKQKLLDHREKVSIGFPAL
jgi:hypothetical protein